jgi:hypothetical protein
LAKEEKSGFLEREESIEEKKEIEREKKNEAL